MQVEHANLQRSVERQKQEEVLAERSLLERRGVVERAPINRKAWWRPGLGKAANTVVFAVASWRLVAATAQAAARQPQAHTS